MPIVHRTVAEAVDHVLLGHHERFGLEQETASMS